MDKTTQHTVEQKAALWDALMNCGRIRVIGHARGGPQGKDGHVQHIGLEVWAEHPISPSNPHNTYERGILTDFAEGMLPSS